MSPSSRRAWIEIRQRFSAAILPMSPSSRRAWIEIKESQIMKLLDLVALLAEGVDRNLISMALLGPWPRSPSSRRAWIEIPKSACMPLWCLRSPSSRRAWIEISPAPSAEQVGTSPSSRRAWIEISKMLAAMILAFVALLAEGVDRNGCTDLPGVCAVGSPSSRRAWIEICGA